MAQQTIDIGVVPNDHTGDPLRTAFTKINANFTELYTGAALLGTIATQDADAVNITGGAISGNFGTILNFFSSADTSVFPFIKVRNTNATAATASYAAVDVSGGNIAVIGRFLADGIAAGGTNFINNTPSVVLGTVTNHPLALLTNNTVRAIISGAGAWTLTGFGLGVLHSSAAGLLTSSPLVTADFAANVVDTDGTFAANSDTRLASQKAVKTYADALIAANDAMVFKGVIDCSANPNYPAADRGHTYKISVAGKIGGASGVNVEVGDTILCITDGTASGTQAAVGANWVVVQVNLDGAVIGPASSTDSGFARFDGTSGKLIKNSAATIPVAEQAGHPTSTVDNTIPRFDGTAGNLQTSGVTIDDSNTLAAVNYAGTATNNNAAAGSIGEYTEAVLLVASRITLTTGVAANVVSLSLTAGDWDIEGSVALFFGATTTVTVTEASISPTSATVLYTPGDFASLLHHGAVLTSNSYVTHNVGRVRKSLAATTTFYLVARTAHLVSTAEAFGILRARRVR